MTPKLRLDQGGLINREKPLSFTFNGRRYQGFEGDTLASALISNGVRIIGRSFKYHRPRGFFSCGVEEPSAIVQLETGTLSLPDQQATRVPLYEGLTATSVNCWPSPDFDLMAVNSWFHRIMPSGFYYKTFMWPIKGWMFYEKFIRKAAGLGTAPTGPDPDHYDKMNIHVDVLIVGAGPSGIMTAWAAAKTGARVLLCDDQLSFGGRLLAEQNSINGLPAKEWINEISDRLSTMDNVTLLPQTTAFGHYDGNFVGLLETRNANNLKPTHQSRQRLWRVRAKQAVLTTGAIERPLVFADNDRPGVMLAASVRQYLNQYGVPVGNRIVLFTNNDDAYQTALDLHDNGIDVPAIIDIRSNPDGDLPTRAMDAGIPIHDASAITAVKGARSVTAVEVMSLTSDGEDVSGPAQTIACDIVCSSGGWNPAVHLYSHSGGKCEYQDDLGIFVPQNHPQNVLTAGSINGHFSLSECLEAGKKIGQLAAKTCGFKKSVKISIPKTNDVPEQPWQLLWVVPSNKPIGQKAKHFVDLQHDVTVADIQLAAREGYRSVEHAKRYTTLGMATDQGKTGNIIGMAVLAKALGVDNPGDVGTTTFRPPYTAVTFGALAGRNVDDLAAPIRRTALHSWHQRVQCQWEDVGDWKRPWYYAKPDETMHDAVSRECLAVRNAVGILDASTLGKIDIQGKDAREFLNRIYTNAWSKLAPGRCRYGLMLGEDGMVFDDGVTTCIDDNHFLMTTTTGGAANVLGCLEEWLQTEWPDLDVYLNSVTEHWATISLTGPYARDLLQPFTNDIDLSNGSFPFMTMQEGHVADIPARIFRISFTGEQTYEINVPARYALSLWEQLMTAGDAYGITPFGTETMHVLRAEKGFIIVGQETDGTVTPYDLGMDWIVSKKKDFIGKRSLSRPDCIRDDRKQLVGLLPQKREYVLTEGAQITLNKPQLGTSTVHPTPMIGHVTSSYFSSTLERSFALAMIKEGRKKIGDIIYITYNHRTVAAEICDPVFYDKDGSRLND